MNTSHEQKADIGLRYTAEVKRRIDVRSRAQAEASLAMKAIELNPKDGFGCPELEKLALRVAKAHRFSAIGCQVKEEYIGGSHRTVLVLYGENYAKLWLPLGQRPDLAGVAKLSQAATDAKRKNSELCREVKFLSECLASPRVGSFQAYASRLWTSNNKGDRMPEPLFKATLEDFLQGQRPAVCSL